MQSIVTTRSSRTTNNYIIHNSLTYYPRLIANIDFAYKCNQVLCSVWAACMLREMTMNIIVARKQFGEGLNFGGGLH